MRAVMAQDRAILPVHEEQVNRDKNLHKSIIASTLHLPESLIRAEYCPLMHQSVSPPLDDIVDICVYRQIFNRVWMRNCK